jgi:CheY-like chemotaxis protein
VVLGNLSLGLGDLSGEGASPELLAVLRNAERAAQRCAEITQRLLTFSSGKVIATTGVDVGSLLSEMATGLRRDLPPTVGLQLTPAGDIWPINGDGGSIEQVVMNLVVNAREAMPSGGTLSLSVANRLIQEGDGRHPPGAQPGRFVEIAVADTGGGITADVRAHLFEPFFTTKDPGRAAGMGLAVAYGIVKAHGGWIDVQSEPGQGSTFRVWLPAAEAMKPRRSDHPARPPRMGECVLVVDDEELIRILAETLLRRTGYEVLTAVDGESALEVYRAKREKIDLVLLDYSMPRLNGLEVLCEMQRIDPDVRVIFSSGYTRDSDSDQLLKSGARAFVPKPYRVDDLVGAVRRVLDQGHEKSSPAVPRP